MADFFHPLTGDYLGSFSDGAEPPEGAIAGPDVADGRDRLNLATMQLIPYVAPVPLIDQLNAVIDSQPLDVQIQFAAVTSAGEMYINQGKLTHLRRLIELTPVDPVLAAAKQELLDICDNFTESAEQY